MVRVETRLDFDNTASTHSTLLQVVAQDGPGLLRQIATTLAAHDCNIEVALIDTEGEIAIDVFYLTIGGAKLDETKQEQLRSDLTLAIEELRPAHAGS
jgi:[protein-PII] uridylyltransferase